MCDHDAKQPLAVHFGNPPPNANFAPPKGSRRRRLWDLPAKCHCPVVGVCFPLDTLRKLVNKALGGQAMADDYEVHVGAVADCVHRNQLSELLQAELERRYALDFLRFKKAKTSDAVFALWLQAVQRGDIAGAFWVALTHPRCDDALQDRLCHDLHMLQHQAGAAVRVDIHRFNAVLDENAVLTRELAKVQERSTRINAERSQEIEVLNAQLIQARADAVARDSRIAYLIDDLSVTKAAAPQLDSLRHKISQLTARQLDLEHQNTTLRQQVTSLNRQVAVVRQDALMPATEPMREQPITLHLNQRTVLCVGGRTGNIANYRELIERVGGRFAHHDGGLEDNANALDASLASADVVICQTGCISHNAYWKVKDFCKRTGKRCVFVENPSSSSLVRGLEQISVDDTESKSLDNKRELLQQRSESYPLLTKE